MKVSQRIHHGIKTRLTYVVPYIDKWPSAMFLGLEIANISNTVMQIHKISDEIWYQAGDKSVDVSMHLQSLVHLVHQEGPALWSLRFNRAFPHR